ncbi:MAG: alpha/beta fold hydrolase [Planctomycetia bacterium]|nr:alpha/beta fold hydrolase [Planctomycetia bacterium]
MNLPDTDWRSQYPFCSRHLQLDKLRYHYLDEGAKVGASEPMVMVHGNPTWSFYWRNLVKAFRGDHRIVVPDHIGCGLSDKPQKYPYTLKQHISNLVRLFDELDLSNVTLLGHDWGGAISLGAALERPDRISRIVLFNTGAFRPHFVPFRIRICRTPLLGTFALRGLNLFARAAITMAVEHPEVMTPAVRGGLLAPYDSWANRVGVNSFVRDIPLTKKHPTWRTLADIEDRLPTLANRPIKLIWGMKDWCFDTSCLDRFEKIFPKADVSRIEDAGHYVIEDAHEQIITLVRAFVADQSPSRAR